MRPVSFPGFWVERTPVHEAAQRGEAQQLQQLIESGACVNQVMVDSITPLHAASLQGQVQCVQLLLAAGAQVSGPPGHPVRPVAAAGVGGTSSGTAQREEKVGLGISVLGLADAQKGKKRLQEAEEERREQLERGLVGVKGGPGPSPRQPHTRTTKRAHALGS